MDITRRDLLKMASVAAIGAAVGQFNVAQAAKTTTKNDEGGKFYVKYSPSGESGRNCR